MEVTQPNSNRFLKGLIYAPSGHGKTRFLGTANDDPRTAPTIMLDYEGGTQSLVGRDIDIVKIESWETFNEVYKFLSSSDHKYKSVSLDSISETHIFALLQLLSNDTRNRKIPDLLEQGDYGIALVQMRRLLRSFRDLPLHVFASALSKTDLDPREGSIIKPSLAGAMADEVQAIFDIVGYLSLATMQGEEGEETHRVLLLQNYPKYRTKARMPENVTDVPDELVDPSVTSLLDALHFDAEPTQPKTRKVTKHGK